MPENKVWEKLIVYRARKKLLQVLIKYLVTQHIFHIYLSRLYSCNMKYTLLNNNFLKNHGHKISLFAAR